MQASIVDSSRAQSEKLAPITNSHQWARRRQRQMKMKSVRDEAAVKMRRLVEEKRSYYAKKLEMKTREHEHRMRVLHLKEQFYTEQLQKLREQ